MAAAARSTVMRLWPTMRQIQMHQLLLLHSAVPTLYSALQCVTQFRMCHACIPTFALPLRMFDRQLSNQSVLHNLIESEGQWACHYLMNCDDIRHCDRVTMQNCCRFCLYFVVCQIPTQTGEKKTRIIYKNQTIILFAMRLKMKNE